MTSIPRPHFKSGISLTDKPAEITTVIASIPIGLVSIILGVRTSAAMSYIFSEYGAGAVARVLGFFWFFGAFITLYGMIRKEYSWEILGVRLLAFTFLIYGLAGTLAALSGGIGSALTGILSISTSVWLHLKANGLAQERTLELWFLQQSLEAGKKRDNGGD